MEVTFPVASLQHFNIEKVLTGKKWPAKKTEDRKFIATKI